ncbi:MAG TPA: urate hydroxylase PuuD, partial [Casimicrobiaceae bacterium]
LHLIAGVAWIGASFYFVMLDNSLSPPTRGDDVKRGVFGELWAVHGGGFYVSQKFLAGPKGEPLSTNLHWSKWEAYTTWLSGMGLLALIYWLGASAYLIDNSVMPLSTGVAIVISIASLAGGLLMYEGLCRALEGRDTILALVLFAFIVACTWALFHLFSARAAYIHVGAMIGTMMVANVFFHIIPGQKKMVADIRAGRAPDPRPGIIGKQRSVHNTYFTLPVLFTMISNHYPMTYSDRHGWLILAVIMLAGVLIRQFFVLRHRGDVKWALPVAGVALLAAVAVAIAPKAANPSGTKVTFASVRTVMAERCLPCHSAEPTQPGFAQPPKGIVLETPEQIAANAPKVAETVGNRYMPIGNLTQMTDGERALIATWFAQGAVTR